MATAQDSVRELMMRSVFEVFEKMYYIFLESRDDDRPDEVRRLVKIRFSGGLSGEMAAYYAEDLAGVMIENALGLDHEEMTEQIIADCLKESLNMICGNFLQKYEQQRVMQLSIPLYEGKASLPGRKDIQGEWISLEGDDKAVDVILRLDDAAEENTQKER